MFRSIQRHPALAFTILSCVLSWVCWIPVLERIQPNPFKSDLDVLLRLLLGGYGPSVAALVIAGANGGWAAVKALLGRFKPRGGGAVPYLVALAWSPLIVAASVMAFVALGGELGYIHWPALGWMPVMFAAVSVFGPLGEELGWRGFLLPRLLGQRGALSASLIIGIVWTGWHAPLMVAAAGTSISGQPVTAFSVFVYLVSVTASSVLFTWIHQRANGSVLAAFLAHLSLNGTSVALGFLLPELGTDDGRAIWLIGVVVLALVAVLLALSFPRSNRASPGRTGRRFTTRVKTAEAAGP